MDALVIATGNALRGDDGVGARALALLGDVPGVETRELLQLTPELASDVAAAPLVVFVDADPWATRVRISEVSSDAPRRAPPLTHAASATAVVALARTLFDWRGAAFTCALPVDYFAAAEGLTARAESSARIGARALRRFLRERA